MLSMGIMLYAQDSKSYTGFFQLQDQDGISKFYFFTHKQKLYGLIYYLEGKDGFQLDHELKKRPELKFSGFENMEPADILKYLDEFVVFKEFEFEDELWKGRFLYREEDEVHELDTKLKLLSKDQLEAIFVYAKVFTEKSILSRIP